MKKRMIQKEVFDVRERAMYVVSYVIRKIDLKTLNEGYKKVYTRDDSVRDYPFEKATLWESKDMAESFAKWLRAEMSVEGRGWSPKTISSIKVETLIVRQETIKTISRVIE